MPSFWRKNPKKKTLLNQTNIEKELTKGEEEVLRILKTGEPTVPCNLYKAANKPAPEEVKKLCDLISNCKTSYIIKKSAPPVPDCDIEKEKVNLTKCISDNYEVLKYDKNQNIHEIVTRDDNNTTLKKITVNKGAADEYHYYKDENNNQYFINKPNPIVSTVSGGRVKTNNTKKRKSNSTKPKNSTNTRKSKNTSSSSKGKKRLTKYKRNNNRHTKKKGTSKK